MTQPDYIILLAWLFFSALVYVGSTWAVRTDVTIKELQRRTAIDVDDLRKRVGQLEKLLEVRNGR